MLHRGGTGKKKMETSPDFRVRKADPSKKFRGTGMEQVPFGG